MQCLMKSSDAHVSNDHEVWFVEWRGLISQYFVYINVNVVLVIQDVL